MKNFLQKKSLSIPTLLILVAAFAFGFDATRENSGDEKSKKDSLKTEIVSIETTIDGKDVKYKGEFTEGKLKTLYKNGAKVSDEDFKKEKKIFLKKLNKLNSKNQKHHAEFTWVSPEELDINIDVDLDKMKQELSMIQKNILMNDSLLSIEMDSLDKKLKKFSIVINDDFEAMHDKKMIKPFRKFKKFYFAPPNGKYKIEINLKKEKDELEKIEKEIEFSSKNLDELKEELLKDGLIKDGEDEIKIEIEDDEILINDKPVPENLKEKYKKLLDERK